MADPKQDRGGLLQTVFTMMVFFSGMLYLTKGPATNAKVFWYRTALLVIGLIGLGVLRWRRKALQRSNEKA